MDYDKILIKVDLDEQNFDEGIRKINRNIKTMSKEVSRTSQAMKFDTGSLSKVQQHLSSVSKMVELNTTKVKELKKHLANIDVDADPDGFEKYQRELIDTEKQLERFQHAQKELMGQQLKLSVDDSAFTRLRNSISKVKASLNELSTKMKTVGSSVKNVGSAMMPVSTAIAAGFGASIKLASDLNESMNKVDVVFGKSANTVKSFGNTTLTSIGLAKGTALDMAAKYGDMATSMGLSQKQAAKMSTSLVKLAGDTASFKNEKIDVVDTALTGVFTGETESLKRLGVAMQDTNVKNFALKNGFKGSWESAQQSEKVMWRYKYVMDALGSSQGDFQRTFDSTANQSRVLGESFKQLGESLGQLLLPIITPVIAKFAEFVQWLATLDPKIQSIIIGVGSVLMVLGPLGMLIGGLISSIGSIISLMSMVLSPIGLIIAAIGGLIVGLTQLSAKQIGLQGDTNALVAIWQQMLLPALQQFGSFIQTVIIPALQQMWVWFQQNIMPILVSFANMIVTQVVPVLQQMWSMFQTYVLPVLKAFADFIFNNVIPVVSDLVQWFMDKIIPIFTRTAQTIMTNMKPAFEAGKELMMNVIDVVKQMWTWFEANLLPVLKSVAEVLMNVLGTALEWVSGIFGKVYEVIIKFVNGALNVVKDVCANVGEGFNELGKVINSIAGIFERVKNALAGGFEWLAGKVNSAREMLSNLNPFDAGGFGGDYTMAVRSYGMDANGFGVGEPINVNLYTTMNVNNNGDKISPENLRAMDKHLLRVIDEGLYKCGRR